MDGSFTEVEITVVLASTTGPKPSSTLSVKVVVSVSPGATRFSAGSKVRALSAAVAAAAVPLKV